MQSTNEVLEEQSVSLTFGDQLRLLKEELYWALFGIGLIVILTFASYRVRK
ncbi:hypothetical protein JCM21714_3741 [Gracilibacillus boraciitolerans JCM 21714]|uniref:Uncharacterized protein n=1 Tax=Gracilibacillus boraciitolerans JCM 21714 TaxID=1298598 RepID=W4VN58_9BACI|nr:hypothetical protein [Gracilibacillus boraciitolerans]GAE94571.1 hypothetical protein JCM21714_3741 [Gracilibacillus boraciitolerans JCM 21714]